MVPIGVIINLLLAVSVDKVGCWANEEEEYRKIINPNSFFIHGDCLAKIFY